MTVTRHASLSAADGGTFVALLMGTPVAKITNIQPPNTTAAMVDQGNEKAAP